MDEGVKKKILVVDDDEAIISLLVRTFQVKGYEVIGLKTGAEARAFIQDEAKVGELALFILDRLLPDVQGLQILKEFQAKYQKKVPVLLLSSLASEKDVLAGLQEGAVDYVTKPFSIPVLIQKAMSLIGKNHG